MTEDKITEPFYTLGQMARFGLIKSKNNGGAIKDKSYLTKILRGQDFKLLPTKHGMAKCLTQTQIDAYNAGVHPRWKSIS